MRVYRRSDRQLIRLEQRPGRNKGHQGQVYDVVGEPDVVAKIYKDSAKFEEEKIRYMVAHPPSLVGAHERHFLIAWPRDIVDDVSGKAIGFLMPKIINGVSLLAIWSSADRQKMRLPSTYDYRLIAARNVAAAFWAAHTATAGYVVGDVSALNVLITSEALPTIIDVDSFGFTNKVSGTVYESGLHSPGYSPPEVTKRTLTGSPRGPYQDSFGLAVLIFQMLLEGLHPFDGISTVNDRDDRIRRGIFPHGAKPHPLIGQKESGTQFGWLTPELQELTIRCFEEGERDFRLRPTAAEWVDALDNASTLLLKCPRETEHLYFQHVPFCPWCRLDRELRPFYQRGLIPQKPYAPRGGATVPAAGPQAGQILSSGVVVGSSGSLQQGTLIRAPSASVPRGLKTWYGYGLVLAGIIGWALFSRSPSIDPALSTTETVRPPSEGRANPSSPGHDEVPRRAASETRIPQAASSWDLNDTVPGKGGAHRNKPHGFRESKRAAVKVTRAGRLDVGKPDDPLRAEDESYTSNDAPRARDDPLRDDDGGFQ